MDGSLDGSVIVVSGASGGLGKACTELLAEEKAILVLIDINNDVFPLADRINASGGSAVPVIADISRLADVKEKISGIISQYGKIDGLANIAAVYRELSNKDFTEISEEEFDRVMAVNVKGTWALSSAVAALIKARKRGSIVNIASGTFYFGAPGLLHYVASKGAVVGMTRSMARELGRHGVRVNCVAPGLLPTESSLGRVSDDYMEMIAKGASLGRLASPEEIARVIRFLLSDESSPVTGQTLIADAGRMLS